MKNKIINLKLLNKFLKSGEVVVFYDGKTLNALDVKEIIRDAASYKILVHTVHRSQKSVFKMGELKSISATVYVYDKHGNEMDSFLIDSLFGTLQANIKKFYKMLGIDVTALDVYNLSEVSKYSGCKCRTGTFFHGPLLTKLGNDKNIAWHLQTSEDEASTKEFSSLDELLDYVIESIALMGATSN